MLFLFFFSCPFLRRCLFIESISDAKRPSSKSFWIKFESFNLFTILHLQFTKIFIYILNIGFLMHFRKCIWMVGTQKRQTLLISHKSFLNGPTEKIVSVEAGTDVGISIMGIWCDDLIRWLTAARQYTPTSKSSHEGFDSWKWNVFAMFQMQKVHFGR